MKQQCGEWKWRLYPVRDRYRFNEASKVRRLSKQTRHLSNRIQLPQLRRLARANTTMKKRTVVRGSAFSDPWPRPSSSRSSTISKFSSSLCSSSRRRCFASSQKTIYLWRTSLPSSHSSLSSPSTFWKYRRESYRITSYFATFQFLKFRPIVREYFVYSAGISRVTDQSPSWK